MAKTAAVLLAPGFEEIEATAPIDILRRAEIHVDILSVSDDLSVSGSRRLILMADRPLAGYTGTPDAVVLPGGLGGARALAASAEARALCERVRAAGGVVAALCASPAVALGPWGFLSQKRATGYPDTLAEFPADARAEDAPVVVDGTLITGRGPGAAMAFGLAVAGAVAGRERAESVRNAMAIV